MFIFTFEETIINLRKIMGRGYLLKNLLISGTCLSLMCACSSQGGKAIQNSVNVPDLPVKGGVSAPFAGIIGSNMVVSGGCNFPDIPAADGGKKAYYDEAYGISLDLDGQGWKLLGKISMPLAYGATAITGNGMVCAGGMSADSAVARSFCIKLSDNEDENGVMHIEELPYLPEAIDNGAAVGVGNDVYVTGGNQANGGNSLYVLRHGAKQWQKLKDYPMGKRVQPVLLATEKTLYLVGGFDYDKAENKCTLYSDMLPYDLETGEWGNPISFPVKDDGSSYAISGASGTVLGSKLLLSGGVDYKIFKEAMEGNSPADYMKKPAGWYKFNDDILIYDTNSGLWSIESDVNGMNKAGGVLLSKDNKLFMVCGEIKPGIRTPEVVVKEIFYEDGNISIKR